MVFRSFKATWDQEQVVSIHIDKNFDQDLILQIENKSHQALALEFLDQKELDHSFLYTYKVEGLDLLDDYWVFDQDRNKALLTYGRIVQSPLFDQTFTYDGEDLGANYSPEATLFKLWAPISRQVLLQIKRQDRENTFPLKRGEKGVWQIELGGNWEGASYHYLHQVNGNWIETQDPYALSSTSNSGDSYVIDRAQISQPIKRAQSQVPPTKAVIYELSVRDFTWQEEVDFKQKGKFLGLLESPQLGKDHLGLSYLRDLGISHVQLMPVYDFGSVDEDFPQMTYNWGYDPVQYNVPEGSFASNLDDPYTRIKELQTLIAGLHAANLSVIMDVVYNHVYQADDFALEKLVPGYCFRLSPDGYRTNGSFCGNDLASERPMIQRYIIQSLKLWCGLYGFDGFRFDLMGLIDQDTLQKAQTQLEALYPNIYLYGEGWRMDTGLDNQLLAHQYNAKELPAYGFFSDDFRNAIKAVALNPTLSLDKDFQQTLEKVLTASCGAYGPEHFLAPHQALNYTECHDNATVYDYLAREDETMSPQRRKKAAKLALTLPLLAQGVPFIHSGQELYRSKQGVENSYNSPDRINSFDWTKLDEERELLYLFQDLCQLRKKEALLTLDSQEAIQAACQMTWLQDGLLSYQLKDKEDQLSILINFSPEDLVIPEPRSVRLASENLYYKEGACMLPSQSFIIQH